MYFRVKQRGAKDTRWRDTRLAQAVSFYARALRIPNAKHLDITMKMSYAKKMINEGVTGRCRAERRDYINDCPTHFTITMQRDMPWTWTLTTFAHEMVHVQQYATGRLRDKFDSALGRWVTSWENGEWLDKRNIPYAEHPWEKEAVAKEQALCEAFFKIEDTTGLPYKEEN